MHAEAMAPWRRAHMSNLVNAFDFSNPDFSVPDIPTAPTPHTDSGGNWDGSSYCESLYAEQQPPVPYGQQQVRNMSSLSEKGFKPVRGALTEGRYLAFESQGYALQQSSSSNSSSASNATGASLTTGKAMAEHDKRSQLFVIHQLQDGSNQFQVSSAVDAAYLTSTLGFTNGTDGAGTFTIQYLGGGQGYSVQLSGGQYLSVSSTGALSQTGATTGFSVFSVTGFN